MINIFLEKVKGVEMVQFASTINLLICNMEVMYSLF